MHRSSTTSHSASHASASGNADERPAKEQRKSQPQQAKKPQPEPVDDNEQYGDADWDDIELHERVFGKARQAIDLLREERQLEQAMRDTFDC